MIAHPQGVSIYSKIKVKIPNKPKKPKWTNKKAQTEFGLLKPCF